MHAVADGVALGSSLFMSFYQDAHGVGTSVMIALIVHKIPEAFGFGSYLAVKKLSSYKFVLNLLAVSATSPLTAFITYLCLVSAA